MRLCAVMYQRSLTLFFHARLRHAVCTGRQRLHIIRLHMLRCNKKPQDTESKVSSSGTSPGWRSRGDFRLCVPGRYGLRARAHEARGSHLALRSYLGKEAFSDKNLANHLPAIPSVQGSFDRAALPTHIDPRSQPPLQCLLSLIGRG